MYKYTVNTCCMFMVGWSCLQVCVCLSVLGHVAIVAVCMCVLVCDAVRYAGLCGVVSVVVCIVVFSNFSMLGLDCAA